MAFLSKIPWVSQKYDVGNCWQQAYFLRLVEVPKMLSLLTPTMVGDQVGMLTLDIAACVRFLKPGYEGLSKKAKKELFWKLEADYRLHLARGDPR